MAFEDGQTALVVKIPEAEPAVGFWRDRYDRSAAAGVPAHVTVLYPFLHRDRIDSVVLAKLTETAASRPPFDARFASFGRFPGVLYLEPAPAEPFRVLTRMIFAQWPEAPPYRGAYNGNVPHLTITQDQPDPVLSEVETTLLPSLPVLSRISALDLVACTDGQWHDVASFPFTGRH